MCAAGTIQHNLRNTRPIQASWRPEAAAIGLGEHIHVSVIGAFAFSADFGLILDLVLQ